MFRAGGTLMNAESQKVKGEMFEEGGTGPQN